MNSNEIKKIIYSILKEILEGDSIPKATDYDITEEQFNEIISLMEDENILNKNNIKRYYHGEIVIKKAINTVTLNGIEFLENNSNWSKVYKGIKEVKHFFTL